MFKHQKPHDGVTRNGRQDDGVTWCGKSDEAMACHRGTDGSTHGATWYRPATWGVAWFRRSEGVTWLRPAKLGVSWCAGTAPTQGVTWMRSTTRGFTWMSGAAFAVLALIATLAPASLDAVAPNASEVGVLAPSSTVEMLAEQSADGVVTLARVRAYALRRVGVLGDGTGIDVALIDTGVAPVDGLLGKYKIVHGPDLSFEGASPEAAYVDTYGHGTHMAGIIAGNRFGAEGIAPGARIVSVKVAGHDGLTTVPQVVAAIDWVVEHRDTDGLNIRVLNLSLGQQGVSEHVGDELSAAVERAWAAGIFVVVAAGNDGDIQPHLDSPAIDPYVMAVGAVDTMSANQKTLWAVPAWSGLGDGDRNPDVVAPGTSIASYRVPGSTIDTAAPWARYGEDFFRGSGTSQAAATVAGVAAALLSTNPTMSNDDLKATLRNAASPITDSVAVRSGAGNINGARSLVRLATGDQNHAEAAGPGSGLVAPKGNSWEGGGWTGTHAAAGWSGSTWSGATWSGATWSGATWSGATWSGSTWSGATWSGATWSGATWSGATWSGATWSGMGWDS